MFTIVKEDISFREWEENDNEFMTYITWIRNIENIEMIGRQEYLLSMNIENIRRYIKSLNDSEYDSFFKVYIKDTFVGTFKIGHIDWRLGSGDAGIMIGNPEFKGKGWSRKILTLGIEYAFDILNLRRLTGGCYSENIAMCKCFENCGFQKEGIAKESLLFKGRYCDHIYYGLLRKYYKKESLGLL